jgi:hypothetical protein
MEQKDKELLFKDLSQRLPYKVKCNVYERIGTLVGLNDYGAEIDYGDGEDTTCEIQYCLPYLRPMSSMTEEEINEFHKLSFIHVDYGLEPLQCVLSVNEIDWLNAHHFDYRGLIKKGLALKASKDMYVTNQ